MVVATIKVLVPEDNLREMIQTLRLLLSPIRNQKGCLGSQFYFEIGDENTLCLIEAWETQNDLENHLWSDEFDILLGAINLLKSPPEMEIKLLSPNAGIEAVAALRGAIDT